MTLLCLDSGNTLLKWGVREQGGWRAQGALPTAAIETLTQSLAAAPGARPTHAIACNVAGQRAQADLAAVAAKLGVPLTWAAACAEQAGVRNAYAQPSRLGADRWAALIGARALRQGASLVVVAGTATTIDVLDAGGHFRGGLILPGLATMRSALASHTAQLPASGGRFQALPVDTADAIASGCLQATAGAIERMFAQLANEPDALCLLSGGAAEAIAPLLAIAVRQIDNLVLEGLARMVGEAV